MLFCDDSAKTLLDFPDFLQVNGFCDQDKRSDTLFKDKF